MMLSPGRKARKGFILFSLPPINACYLAETLATQGKNMGFLVPVTYIDAATSTPLRENHTDQRSPLPTLPESGGHVI